MTMRYAIVKNGIVVNAVEVEDGSDWHPGDGLTLVPAVAASTGWTYDGKTFSEPVVDAPVKTVFDGADFLVRLTDAEYGAILAAAAQSIQLARWLDTFRLRGEIDVTGKTALAAKAGLVKAGLLAPDRADVIFAAG